MSDRRVKLKLPVPWSDQPMELDLPGPVELTIVLAFALAAYVVWIIAS